MVLLLLYYTILERVGKWAFCAKSTEEFLVGEEKISIKFKPLGKAA